MKKYLSIILFSVLTLWYSADVLAFETAIDIVGSCPTETEISSIHRDFNMVFKNLKKAYSCTPGNKSSRRLVLYNIFRLLKNVSLSKQLLWTTNKNPYDWLKSLKLKKIVFSNDGGSSAGTDTIYISGAMFNESEDRDHTDVYQLLLLSGVLLHEARHTMPGGACVHTGDCRQGSDATLSEMGAWAVQYHYFRLLREDSGAYLSTRVKDLLKISMGKIGEK